MQNGHLASSNASVGEREAFPFQRRILHEVQQSKVSSGFTLHPHPSKDLLGPGRAGTGGARRQWTPNKGTSFLSILPRVLAHWLLSSDPGVCPSVPDVSARRGDEKRCRNQRFYRPKQRENKGRFCESSGPRCPDLVVH